MNLSQNTITGTMLHLLTTVTLQQTINTFLMTIVLFHSDELIVLSASGTAACIELQLPTTEPTGISHGILFMYMS